jgi:hypothetical protein
MIITPEVQSKTPLAAKTAKRAMAFCFHPWKHHHHHHHVTQSIHGSMMDSVTAASQRKQQPASLAGRSATGVAATSRLASTLRMLYGHT